MKSILSRCSILFISLVLAGCAGTKGLSPRGASTEVVPTPLVPVTASTEVVPTPPVPVTAPKISEQSTKTKAALSSYPLKTTPVSADTFVISDSEASNATKRVTVGSFLDSLPSLSFSTGLTLTEGGQTDSVTVNIDDTKGNGDTNYIWSADKVYDQLALKIGADSSDTLTNKTFDANATGNVLKGYGYITFAKPNNRGSATGAVGTTETSILYGVPSFADDVETNNYVDYIGEVPRDLDTGVDMVAYFKFRLGGADTGDHSYKISMIAVADSGTAEGTPGDSVTLAYTADASGAAGDVETATGTLTNWKTNATAGSFWLIRVTRDGDDATNDSSTVDSYPLELTIRYGFSQ